MSHWWLYDTTPMTCEIKLPSNGVEPHSHYIIICQGNTYRCERPTLDITIRYRGSNNHNNSFLPLAGDVTPFVNVPRDAGNYHHYVQPTETNLTPD